MKRMLHLTKLLGLFVAIVAINLSFAGKSLAADTTSVVVANAQTPSGAVIKSTVDTEAEAVEVFRFTVKDSASADGIATKVTKMVFKPGANNTDTNWSKTIDEDGVEFRTDHSGDVILTDSVIITASTISAYVASGHLNITDGGATSVRMSIFLTDAGTLDDRDSLQFKVDAASHGWEVEDTLASGFHTTFGADVTSNVFKVVVDPTKVILTSSFGTTRC